jgi:hypothetical protein
MYRDDRDWCGHRALEVMKFAKHLNEAKLAKYEGCYFGYSSLKTTLKQMVEEKPNITGYLRAAEHGSQNGLTHQLDNHFYDDHAGKEMTMVETFIESKGFQVRRRFVRMLDVNGTHTYTQSYPLVYRPYMHQRDPRASRCAADSYGCWTNPSPAVRIRTRRAIRLRVDRMCISESGTQAIIWPPSNGVNRESPSGALVGSAKPTHQEACVAQATKICLELLQWCIDLEKLVKAGKASSTDASQLRELLSQKTDEVRPPGGCSRVCTG